MKLLGEKGGKRGSLSGPALQKSTLQLLQTLLQLLVPSRVADLLHTYHQPTRVKDPEKDTKDTGVETEVKEAAGSGGGYSELKGAPWLVGRLINSVAGALAYRVSSNNTQPIPISSISSAPNVDNTAASSTSVTATQRLDHIQNG